MKHLKNILSLILVIILTVSSALALEELQLGSKGSAVKEMQSRLKELGFYNSKIDGDFGNKSKEAVMAFQEANGLKQDGIASVEVLELMYSENARNAPPFDESSYKTFSCPAVNGPNGSADEWCQDKDFRALFSVSILVYDLAGRGTKVDVNMKKENYVVKGNDEKIYLLTQGDRTITLIRYDTISNSASYLTQKGGKEVFDKFLSYFRDTLKYEVFRNSITDINEAATTMYNLTN